MAMMNEAGRSPGDFDTDELFSLGCIVISMACVAIISACVAVGFFFGDGWGFAAAAILSAVAAALFVSGDRKKRRAGLESHGAGK